VPKDISGCRRTRTPLTRRAPKWAPKLRLSAPEVVSHSLIVLSGRRFRLLYMGSGRAIAALPTKMKLRRLIRPLCSRGDAERLPVLRETCIDLRAMGGHRTRAAVGHQESCRKARRRGRRPSTIGHNRCSTVDFSVVPLTTVSICKWGVNKPSYSLRQPGDERGVALPVMVTSRQMKPESNGLLNDRENLASRPLASAGSKESATGAGLQIGR